MRIGLVIYGSLDTISGGFLYDRQLVEHLQRAGDRVEIISIPWRNYVAHMSDNWSADLFQRLSNSHFEVLLQDELNHPSLFQINRRLRGAASYPIFSIVHHLRSSETHPAPQLFFYRWVERRYLANIDGFIFNSHTTRAAVSQLLERAPTSCVVAYPAGDRFNPQIDSTTIINRARELGALRIVFVGNLIPRKGLHILLDALARLSAGAVQLIVVGNPNVDAKYAAYIRARIEQLHLKDVRLVGALQDDALADVLEKSQLLVVPSEYEGYGIVYLEGMSFGLPAIATTSGAAGEIIADGINGFLVAPNEPAMLAERIDGLNRDRERLAQMGRAARERFLVHPHWDESMARIRNYVKHCNDH